ncbi:conserved protein of unknown function [Georgfuchsia toluolica]|uniref:SPOR domain-containing protein n=1 Tax=Georgfuchsia toluolica TaxID=424218 RepID=A0A916J7F2_9PROT|nr:SPOR domain-containing protein [Georgfuchsia toluolica]CAG4884565.1 conserved protein of unknown function [Georgfuchsia toluolica]
MARTVFLLLVLLNLLAFAWVYLKGDDRINAGREPQRAKSELAVDKIRLLTPVDSVPESCRAFVGATVVEAQEIAKAWSEKLPAAHITVNSVMPHPVFDMVIAGLASRAVAEAKLVQLKSLGISEALQVKTEDGKRFSVLMATFTERGAADEALKNVAQKGVRSAVIIQRQAALAQPAIEVRGGDAILKPLAELASLHRGLTAAQCDAARGAP